MYNSYILEEMQPLEYFSLPQCTYLKKGSSSVQDTHHYLA